MRLDRSNAVLIVAVLAVAGILTWRISQSPRQAPAPAPEAGLPQIRLEPKETIDQFLAQLETDSFKSIGIEKAAAFDQELTLGWNRKWLELPEQYRRETVITIGRAWNLYYGGVTRVYAVPSGDELARYSPPPATRAR